MRKIAALAIAAFVLVGCGHPIANPLLHDAPVPKAETPAPEVKTIVKQVCAGTVSPWTPADLSAVADIISKSGKGSVLWAMEQDWQRMRDSLRACKKNNP